MRILVLTDGFYPEECGGITNSILREVNSLVRRGHSVTVITRRLVAGATRCDSLDGYQVLRYPSPSLRSALYRTYPLGYFTTLPFFLRDVCRQARFDVAFIHNPYQVVAAALSRIGVPILYACHAPATEIDLDADVGKYGAAGGLVRIFARIARRLQLQALKRADAVLTHSEFMKTHVSSLYRLSHGRSGISVIPIIVDSDRFTPGDSEAARAKLGLPVDRPILLTVRRLVARMGLENLIRAVAISRHRHSGLLLLMAGKGYLAPRLRGVIDSLHLGDTVRLLGFVPESSLADYYRAADLSVMPSVQLEGFGCSTVESLSCGTPVIGTPIGATPEVIGPLCEELLTRGYEPASIAERLDWWLERRSQLSMLGRSCREYCLSRFGADAVAPRLEALLEAVAGGVGAGHQQGGL